MEKLEVRREGVGVHKNLDPHKDQTAVFSLVGREQIPCPYCVLVMVCKGQQAQLHPPTWLGRSSKPSLAGQGGDESGLLGGTLPLLHSLLQSCITMEIGGLSW